MRLVFTVVLLKGEGCLVLKYGTCWRSFRIELSMSSLHSLVRMSAKASSISSLVQVVGS